MSRPLGLDTPNMPHEAAQVIGDVGVIHANAVQHTIDELFNGDSALFERFRALTLPRLKAEVEKADVALAAEDYSALADVMHNLKSVLRLIGQVVESEWAQNLDALARQGHREACAASWAALRGALQSLYAPPGGSSD